MMVIGTYDPDDGGLLFSDECPFGYPDPGPTEEEQTHNEWLDQHPEVNGFEPVDD